MLILCFLTQLRYLASLIHPACSLAFSFESLLLVPFGSQRSNVRLPRVQSIDLFPSFLSRTPELNHPVSYGVTVFHNSSVLILIVSSMNNVLRNQKKVVPLKIMQCRNWPHNSIWILRDSQRRASPGFPDLQTHTSQSLLAIFTGRSTK